MALAGGLVGAAYLLEKGLELGQNESHHDHDLFFTQKSHLIQLFSEQEQNQCNIDNDMLMASKEAQRDMFDASNQKLQTAVLSSSIMFAALSTVIVQGQIPDDTDRETVDSIAFLGTISFVFLFIAMVISIELLHKTSTFMMKYTRDMDKKIESISSRRMQRSSLIEHLVSGNSQALGGLKSIGIFSFTSKVASGVSDVIGDIWTGSGGTQEEQKVPEGAPSSNGDSEKKEIEDYWRQQGALYIQRLKDTRADIKDIYMPSDLKKNDFCTYWTAECATYADISDWFFYSGTCLLLATTAAYLFAFFHDGFGRRVGAYFCVVLCGLTLVVVSVCVFLDRMWDINKRRKQQAKQNREDECRVLEKAGLLSLADLSDSLACDIHTTPPRWKVQCFDCAHVLHGRVQHVIACVDSAHRRQLHARREELSKLCQTHLRENSAPSSSTPSTLPSTVSSKANSASTPGPLAPDLASCMAELAAAAQKLGSLSCLKEGETEEKDEDLSEFLEETLKDLRQRWLEISSETTDSDAMDKCRRKVAELEGKQADWIRIRRDERRQRREKRREKAAESGVEFSRSSSIDGRDSDRGGWWGRRLWRWWQPSGGGARSNRSSFSDDFKTPLITLQQND